MNGFSVPCGLRPRLWLFLAPEATPALSGEIRECSSWPESSIFLVHWLRCPRTRNRDVRVPCASPAAHSSQTQFLSEGSPADRAGSGDPRLPGPPTGNEAAARNEAQFLPVAFSRFRLELIRVTTVWLAAKEKGYWCASKKQKQRQEKNKPACRQQRGKDGEMSSTRSRLTGTGPNLPPNVSKVQTSTQNEKPSTNPEIC